MNTKVKNYINQDEFTKSESLVLRCYEDFFQQDKSFLNYDEQKELFEYFLKKREERVLFSFTFFQRYTFSQCYTLGKIPSFSQIQSIIKDTLCIKIEELFTKEQLTIEECFDFLDYINSLSEVLDNKRVLYYFKHGLSSFKKTIKQDNTTDYKNYIEESLCTLVYILRNARIIIDNEIIIQLTELKDILNKKYFSDLQLMYINLILFQDPEDTFIDPVYKDILLFIFEFNSYNLDLKIIIDKIEDLDLLKELLSRFFPEKKDLYRYHCEQFEIIFLIINRLKQLNTSVEEILNTYLNKEQKEELLKYIGYTYKSHIDQTLEVEISSNKINIDYLKQPLQDYIIQLSSDPNFEFNCSDTIYWSDYIFKYLINTPELYNKCSESAKEVYHSLVVDENDPLWGILPPEVQSKVLENNHICKQIHDKKNKISELRTNKRISCINDFFNKDIDFIKDEINQIKEYFGKSIITVDDICSYNKSSDCIYVSKINEFLNKDIVILNTFLIRHLYRMYFFFKEDQSVDHTINIDDVFEKLLNNWDQYWGLYLYNYLIEIKEYDFQFTPEQQEKLRTYFTILQDDKTIPIYIYWYLEQLFHSSIILTKDTIIQLFKINYLYLKNDYPVTIIIYDKPCYDELCYDKQVHDSLDFDKKDFSDFILAHHIDKKEVLNKLLENIKIKDSCFKYDNEYSPYFHLLSIINIYLLLDDTDKLEYINIIKNLCKDYIVVTIQKAQEQPHTSSLVFFMIEQFELTLDILQLINNSEIIHEMHLAYVTKIQEQYFRQCEWDKYKNTLYNIRKDIELNNKKVILDNYQRQAIILSNNEKDELIATKKEIEILKENNFSIDPHKNNELAIFFNKISKIFNNKYNQENKSHEVKFNFVYLLAFLDMDDDIDIWKIFCEKALKETYYFIQDLGSQILEYIIQHCRINKMDQFVDCIVQYYDLLPELKKYASGNFEFIRILKACIQNIITRYCVYDTTIYQKLLKIKNLDIYQKDGLNYRKQIAGVKFVEITYSNNEYLLNQKSYDTVDKLVDKYLSQKLLTDNSFVSQIRSSDYLINDIINETWTMSHPYCFEDPIENQYPIDKPLYISCWSFTNDKNNAYAWWKLYGNDKKSFRSIIPIKSLIKSAVSILNKCSNSTLYIGSVEYDLPVDNQEYHHSIPEEFFKKRQHFSFETEFRVMISIHEKDIDKVKLLQGDFINKRYSFTIDEYDVYKDIQLNDSFETPKFNPFIVDILDKDKKAILRVIEQKKKKLENNK